MFGQSRTLALAVATAGLIGMSAPMASAATGPTGGDSGGLVNISHNQVPVQVCNDFVPVNVLGVQVPVDDLAGALGLLNPGDTVSLNNSSCHQKTGEIDNNGSRGGWGHSWRSYRPGSYRSTMAAPASLPAGMSNSARPATMSRYVDKAADDGPSALMKDDGGAGGDSGGLLNVSDNQVPIQACNITVPVNVLGVQVPLDKVVAALGLASPGNTVAGQNASCHGTTGQANNNG